MVHLPEAFTDYIETNFYGKVTEQSTLEAIVNDDSFLEHPFRHVALFSDHGIVHGRDIASKITQVLLHINGELIPERTGAQLEFMLGYGVMLAYLHDIGMRDFSAFGRAIHPEFAAQLVFTREFDPLIDLLWQENSGNVAWRLMNLASPGPLQSDPKLVLRELLALSMGHSKSKVPIALLNDPHRLRATLQKCLQTDLHHLYHQQQIDKIQAALNRAKEQPPDTALIHRLQQDLERAQAALLQWVEDDPRQPTNPDIQPYYPHFSRDSFHWLNSSIPELQALALDVIDTVRALRCADALRQRGHTFRTSAGYEVLVDQHTAHAVYALHTADGSKLFLLEGKDAISSGEANMTGCELDQNRNLRVSFDRGAFSSPEAVQWAVYSAAVVINDIQADVIDSFLRPGADDPAQPVKKRAEAMQIIVEGVDDNPDFALAVCQKLGHLNPAIAHRCRAVASLQKADMAEVERYLHSPVPVWSLEDKIQILAEVAKAGQRVDHLDLDQGFEDIKLITLKAEEVLFEPGSPSSFVYIPTEPGLKVLPDGGYTATQAQAWSQLGNTAAIKGSVRNARVIAQQDTDLLMIPKQVYLRHWYNPYRQKEFGELFNSGDGSTLGRRHLLMPMAVHKKHLNKTRRQRYLPLALHLRTLFRDPEQVAPFLTYLEKLPLSKGDPLFCQGDPVEALYLLEKGQIHLTARSYGETIRPVQMGGPGDLLGAADFYTQSTYQATAVAVHSSQVYRLSREALQRMQGNHPAAAIAFGDMVLTQIAGQLPPFKIAL